MSLQKGNWVASNTQIGTLREVHDDGLLDIVLFGRDGKAIGRQSPAVGGPSGYEPCCDPEGWRKIKKPLFPLSNQAYVDELVEFA